MGKPLTPRQQQILPLLGDGLENWEIAMETGLSQQAVARHVERIIERLGAHNRLHVVALAAIRSVKEP